ncbi:hypothetical protein SAMN05216559_1782 [Halomicrobium zhouii]|uniref:Uncharacterized protein n=1 Tax=Halomicrobium zhouii TaxID=767519 RepID=A0A1I6L1N7_9EURY|nr:hypothetical protein SAMN05216559_1782 [Halomicrobium zhouii]
MTVIDTSTDVPHADPPSGNEAIARLRLALRDFPSEELDAEGIVN